MNDSVKNVWKPLCIVFAALLALSWVFFGFLYSKGGVDFSTLENPEQNYTAGGGAVIDEGKSNGIALMSAEIPVEEFAENDVSPLAETAYTLTATITPASAVDKTVDWSVSFVNPESEWASGKTVTDYVTVTPEADGALTATVECLQAFGEQVTVTVTSRDVETVSANCVCNYVKRVTFLGGSGNYLRYSDGGYVGTIPLGLGMDKEIVFHTPTYSLGVGTVEPNVEFSSRRAVLNQSWLEMANSRLPNIGYSALDFWEDYYFTEFNDVYSAYVDDIYGRFLNPYDDDFINEKFLAVTTFDSVYRRYFVGFCCDYEVTYNGETFGSGTWWASGSDDHLTPYYFDISVDAMQSHVFDIRLSESELAY